jgi:hypothetical protein
MKIGMGWYHIAGVVVSLCEDCDGMLPQHWRALHVLFVLLEGLDENWHPPGDHWSFLWPQHKAKHLGDDGGLCGYMRRRGDKRPIGMGQPFRGCALVSVGWYPWTLPSTNPISPIVAYNWLFELNNQWGEMARGNACIKCDSHGSVQDHG